MASHLLGLLLLLEPVVRLVHSVSVGSVGGVCLFEGVLEGLDGVDTLLDRLAGPLPGLAGPDDPPALLLAPLTALLALLTHIRH